MPYFLDSLYDLTGHFVDLVVIGGFYFKTESIHFTTKRILGIDIFFGFVIHYVIHY